MNWDSKRSERREELADGRSLAETARLLIDRGVGPIRAIKAMRAVSGAKLAELKEAIDLALPADVLGRTERVRDEFEAAARAMADEESD